MSMSRVETRININKNKKSTYIKHVGRFALWFPNGECVAAGIYGAWAYALWLWYRQQKEWNVEGTAPDYQNMTSFWPTLF